MEDDLPLPVLFSEDELDEILYQTIAKEPEPVVYDPMPIIEQHFPRIHMRIKLLWGSIELYNYLNDIILDDRHFANGQMRQGFPKEVLEALLHIHKLHTRLAGVIEHIPVADKWTNAK